MVPSYLVLLQDTWIAGDYFSKGRVVPDYFSKGRVVPKKNSRVGPSKNCVRYFEEGTPINSQKAKRGVFHFCFCSLIEISIETRRRAHPTE